MWAEITQVMGNGTLELKIGNDPFPVTVRKDQVRLANDNGNVVESKKKVRKPRPDKEKSTRMPSDTATKPSAKDLVAKAKSLGINGWAEMDRDELQKAIKRAKKKGTNGKGDKPVKTKTVAKAKPKKATATKAKTTKAKSKPKKAPATKATNKPKATSKPKKGASESSGDRVSLAKTHPKPLPDEGVIPFRKGSNLFPIAKLLLRGGVRESLAQKLAEKVTLHPYQKESGEIDLLDYDKRLLLCAQTMRDEYGYGIQRTGRGMSGTILVFRPGGSKDPRSKAKAKSKKAKAKK